MQNSLFMGRAKPRAKPNVMPASRQLTLNTIWLTLLYPIIFATVYLETIWTLIPYDRWQDLQNYIERFDATSFGVSFAHKTWSEVVTTEVGWAWWIDRLLHYGLSVDQALQVSSLLALILTVSAMSYRTNKWWIPLFLINPSAIDLFVSQVRSAVALSIVLFALVFLRIRYVLTGTALAATIHTGSPLFLPPYFVNIVNTRRFNFNKWLITGTMAAIALSLVIFQQTILSSLGDRRSDYAASAESGRLFALSWIIILLVYLILSKRMLSLYGVIFTFLIVMFSSSYFFGLYAARYASFASVIAPYLVSLDFSSAAKRRSFEAIYISYTIVYFFYWLGQQNL
jgi:hypothetical protein